MNALIVILVLKIKTYEQFKINKRQFGTTNT